MRRKATKSRMYHDANVSNDHESPRYGNKRKMMAKLKRAGRHEERRWKRVDLDTEMSAFSGL